MLGAMRTLVPAIAILVLLIGCDDAPEAQGGTESSTGEAEMTTAELAAAVAAMVEPPPPEVARPYDDDADAEADIAAAVARAGSRRVLVVFGGNWCVWCRRLEHVLQTDAAVETALANFEVVHVSIDGTRSRDQEETNQRYGNPVRLGLPVLVVLDGSGEVVATQETGSLETGDRHDPAKIVEFLNRVGG
ncbi:MAG: hypothetical protein DRJ42_10065 [Deltaproteobacteria bacterium]|nr:MAG: hypothetical protein DRJ42_10065 [Deltaproteobacteria bacterium]